MKIKLDNLDDRDGCVLITTDDREAAIADQSIAGARWEAPGDMNEAYAMPTDHPGLLAELKADGYDVDDSEYSPPARKKPAWPLQSKWPQREPVSPRATDWGEEYKQQPPEPPAEDRQVYCAGCDHRILPGQDVRHVENDDPWKGLWHTGCLRQAVPK